ncbi:MAG TPA: squalene/phytoene synthase family protein [Ramlibacter sp.]|nr:squalene/phytoene synthase family protein [Ramlibacter sp.]HVZ43464.1 squalene/phytoene synthase family protein [Ramlibacter sp.]
MSAAHHDASFRPVDHYENFPVASWLCPPRLKAPIAAIYWFARTADDIADEGDATAEARLADLAAYRADLHAALSGARESGRWPRVFEPLARAVRAFALPAQPLSDLLSAFEQDVEKTRDAEGYASREELLDYCRRSANPIGRLLLHLYGMGDARSLAQSDAICTALQLINFWQDASRDLPRGRFYIPAHEQLPALVAWARETMMRGAPLVHTVPGRAGWELRFVVQGGLRILDKIEAMDYATATSRPRLRAWDAPILLWRAWSM